jgi:acyl-CoA thioesterase-1
MDRILRTLADRDIPTLVGGMPAPFNMDPDYRASFDAIYPELTREHGAMLEPFFLEGVALVSSLNQNDGIHPNADGVAKIIDRMMPQIEMLLEKAKSARADS